LNYSQTASMQFSSSHSHLGDTFEKCDLWKQGKMYIYSSKDVIHSCIQNSELCLLLKFHNFNLFKIYIYFNPKVLQRIRNKFALRIYWLWAISCSLSESVSYDVWRYVSKWSRSTFYGQREVIWSPKWPKWPTCDFLICVFFLKC